MPNTKKTSYPEIEEIKTDLESLKTNVVELTEHVRKDGERQAAAATETVSEKVSEFAYKGEKKISSLKRTVKERPAESVGAAFAAGLILSAIFGRK